MIELGRQAILVGWILAAYAVVTALIGGWRRKREFVASAENAALAVWGDRRPGRRRPVARSGDARLPSRVRRRATAARTLPINYTITALWGGQTGSLLFWAVDPDLDQRGGDPAEPRQEPRADALRDGDADERLAVLLCPAHLHHAAVRDAWQCAAEEGRDLNPLLQNYWMTIHPPSLYLGFVGMSVPFAFAIAALATGRLDDVWIRTTRRWTLFAWFFLSLGNLFGAQWAYEVLGWGGYWAWDPVENAAFMPWLTGTAFLHSVMIQEKKNMLKVWNMVLVILTFSLTIFGTFLTRSGVISSVHSFTQSGLGPVLPGLPGDRADGVARVCCSGGCRCCAAKTSSTRWCRASRRSCSTT